MIVHPLGSASRLQTVHVNKPNCADPARLQPLDDTSTSSWSRKEFTRICRWKSIKSIKAEQSSILEYPTFDSACVSHT